jgi:hypothetical protein
LIMGRTWYVIPVFDAWGIVCFPFYMCFVKASIWWGVTRSAQPHILTYMFSPYVISTPLLVTWKVTNVNFQKICFSCTLLTALHLRNELRYHCCLSQPTVFHRALACYCLLQQKDRVVFMVQEY